MSEKAFLSKSTFIRGMQCVKSLYLHKKRPFLRDRLSAGQLAKFSRGHKVGLIARGLFPGGIDVSPKSHYQMGAAIKNTTLLVGESQPVIYEASFSYKSVRVALDILYLEDGKWKAVEVKSSAAISETYLWDASLQYYVINGSGIQLDDFSLAYVNCGYVRSGEVDLKKLFIVESVLELVKTKQVLVAEKIEQFREVNMLTRSPEVTIGPHCTDPYPCDFIGHCWKREAARPDTVKISLNHEAFLANSKAIMPKAAFFSSLHFKPAIPPFDGSSPYLKLPFSFGLMPHNCDERDIFFIVAEPGMPFQAAQISSLFKQLEAFDSLLVYHKETEIQMLRTACKLYGIPLERIAGIGEKMIEMVSGLSRDQAAWSVHGFPENPEEALTALGVKQEMTDNDMASPLEASVFYGGLSEELMTEDWPANERRIKVFHAGSLVRLRQLFVLLTES